MVDACAMHGIYPYYGPFGDIQDVVACEDQFRNAFLLGCVGTWSLHPVQIEIAKRVFSPSAEDVAHARRVVAAMGDGTGAVMLDGKMEDDASLKQCLVIVELAERLSQTDPALAELYADARGATPREDPADSCPQSRKVRDDAADGIPPPALGALHAELQRARTREGEDAPRRRPHPRPRGRRRARREGGGARERLCRSADPASTAGAS